MSSAPATTCLSLGQSSQLLAGIGAVLLVTTLAVATAQEGRPLKHLGYRPKGHGLLSYLYHAYTCPTDATTSSTSRVVMGYDPIQGALSPLLRLLVHVSFIFFFWSLLVAFWPVDMVPNACLGMLSLSLAVWQAGFCAITTYAYVVGHVVHTWLPPVSDPGGPRPHKIQRKPQWPCQKQHALDLIATTEWKVAVGDDAHAVTQERLPTASLTGESSGRDIWTHSSSNVALPLTTTTTTAATTPVSPLSFRRSSNKGTPPVEELVLRLACGGRPTASFDPSVNPNACDIPYRAQLIRRYLSQPGHTAPPTTTTQQQQDSDVDHALTKAVHFYSMLQTENGHWSGDYGGPLFLMPGLVVAWYVMHRPSNMLNAHELELMTRYIVVHQQVDGGWGTHIESPSTMFGTTLNYVALRLMGMKEDHPVCQKGRQFIQENGGAVMTSSWAKFYLCLLGCMHWDGHNSVPPEMWLLSNWFPFHPGRMWCHARMVYLPMGYVYGSRMVYDKAESDPLILSLRKELYCQPYDSITWIKTRHMVAPMDNYSPIHPLMAMVQNLLARYETWSVFAPVRNWVRRYGLAFCADYMAAEDLQTNFIDIGPVNKVLNMLSAYHLAGGNVDDPTVINHFARVPDYLWVAEDGMKMKGYNGSQCWDTTFAIQAIYEAGLLDAFPDVARKAWSFLERTQILSNETSQATVAYQYESAANRKKYYRHLSKGGWPFSTSAHGWPISDCTSEGLKGALCLLKCSAVKEGLRSGNLRPITEKRLQNAVSVLLTYQNEDGGWATYENNRGYGWYESLNPSEVFGDIMIDYSYVECSVATLTALVEFHAEFPFHRADEIKQAIVHGRAFVKSLQREDGSFYGSWACCFCYGAWFGLEGLVKCGEPLGSESVSKGCEFLLKHQRPNGGWGEDFTSCYDKDYAINGMEDYGDEGSGVVNTAWALLALSAAQCDDIEAVRRGVKYLIKRQLPCGDWPQEGIAGVFNRACGITYTAYRNVFPIWALGRCREIYGTRLDE